MITTEPTGWMQKRVRSKSEADIKPHGEEFRKRVHYQVARRVVLRESLQCRLQWLRVAKSVKEATIHHLTALNVAHRAYRVGNRPEANPETGKVASRSKRCM